MKFMHITKRLIASPLIFGLLVITHIFFCFKRTYHFIRYGGEFIQYKKDDPTTIQDIYLQLKNQKTKP